MMQQSLWYKALSNEMKQGYYLELQSFIEKQLEIGKTIYPEKQNWFNALHETPLENVKVVILGQDPYHGPNQAHGLSFSVLPGVKVPPSLRNMYKELAQDIDGFEIPNHGTLTPWAQQGVLLLNTVLTVEQANAGSHAKKGWERFTDKIIEVVNQECDGVVFLLWGAHAQKKAPMINTDKHYILTAPHPSPLSAHHGWFGCQHFSKTNALLKAQNKTPIDWQV